MKIRLNYPLIIGIIIVSILILLCLYPENFSDSDPYGIERSKFVYVNGVINYFSPPVEPCKEYPWGTDQNGRDMKSLIVYGSRLTLLIAVTVAVFRLLIALPVSILASYNNRLSIWLIKQSNVIFNAFPLVILILILERIKIVKETFKQANIIIVFFLIIFGWSRLGALLKEKVDSILNEDFIEGEIAIGKNRIEIALQNILPHLIPSIIVFLFMEIASVLLILSQIGVFGILFSGGYYNEDGVMQLPYEVDWTSLLVASQKFISVGKIWLVFYPALAFSMSIIGFNLLGEGLKLEFERKNSRIISYIRRIPAIFSPFILIYEIKHFKEHKKKVVSKLLFYSAIIFIVFMPNGYSEYKFNELNAFNIVNYFSEAQHKGRKAGMGYNKALAEYIASELKEYGLEPFERSYIHEYSMQYSYNVKESYFKVKSETEEIELVHRKDYYITTPIPVDGSFQVKKISLKDFDQFPLPEEICTKYRDKMILIDVRGMKGPELGRFLGVLNNFVKPKGVIYISDWHSEDNIRKSSIDRPVTQLNPVLNISVSSDMGEELMRMGDSNLDLMIKTDMVDNTKGYNVTAMIPGNNKKLQNDLIVVGSCIDSVGDDDNSRFPSSMEAAGNALSLEIAHVLGGLKDPPERTILFVFWDSSLAYDRGSKEFVDMFLSDEGRRVFYIDLRNFGYKGSKKIVVDTSNILPKDKVAQKFVKTFNKSANKNDVGLTYAFISSPIVPDFIKKDINCMIIDNSDIDKIYRTPEDNIKNISVQKLKIAGQVVLDMLYEMSYGGVK